MEVFPERIFGSSKGLHIEFRHRADAEAFYQEGLRLGNRVEIHGTVVIALNSKQTDKRSQC